MAKENKFCCLCSRRNHFSFLFDLFIPFLSFLLILNKTGNLDHHTPVERGTDIERHSREKSTDSRILEKEERHSQEKRALSPDFVIKTAEKL